MSDTKCNYQRAVTREEFSAALSEAVCGHCGVTTRELLLKGELLEVCGEEFSSDIVSGQRVLTPIALCPACHKIHHLDGRRQHNPCQIEARRSREWLT